jgi:carbon-monoxide dehydrogenase medium subunit
MKPPVFDYHAPDTVEAVLALLAEHGDGAKILAGGQSLIPAMNFRLAQPAVLIDLNGVAGLDGIERLDSGGGALTIRAMTRQRTVERSALVAQHAPLVAETMPHIAHPQIRNRGTFCGSIAHADPASELPAVVLALEGRCHLRRQGGERWVDAADFFTGLFATAIEPEEMLVAVELPSLPPRTGVAFEEFARRHGDYALVGVAAVVTVDPEGRCTAARITLLSVGEGPVAATGAAAGLVGEKGDEGVIRAAAATAATRDIDPPGDIHASVPYRRHLARVLTQRVLRRAFARAL